MGESASESASPGAGTKTRITMRPLGDPAADAPQADTSAPPASDDEGFDVSYGHAPGSAKLRKNPLVPLGALVTGGVLIAGLFAFKSGNSRLSQSMMRARVLAQGATLAVLGISVAGMTGAASGAADADADDAATAR